MDTSALIQLLYAGSMRLGSFSAEYRDWSKRLAPSSLIVAQDPNAAGGIRWVGGSPYPTASSTIRRFWMETPSRLRVEIVRARDVVVAGVRDGTAWWLWNDEQGEHSGNQDSLPQVLEPLLLAPHRLLSSMWLEVTGSGHRADRDVVCARGVPRDPDGPPTTFEFEFDRENGTILRRAAYTGGVCTTSTEAINVRHNPMISPETFKFARRAVSEGNLTAVEGPNVRAPFNSPVWGSTDRHSNAAKTVWLTGLSGAGKTTIATEAERLLVQLGYPCCVLDGDILRSGVSSDLACTREDRREQARRAAEIAVMLARSGIVPIVALISPYAQDRLDARAIQRRVGIEFLEVWVDTPVEICAQRDVKGLYHSAGLSGLSPSDRLPGLQSPYEPPKKCELVIEGFGVHPRLAARQIVDAVVRPASVCPSGWTRAADFSPRLRAVNHGSDAHEERKRAD